MTMPIDYSLEIYTPEDKHPMVVYLANTPFATISVGEFLHPGEWPGLAPHRYLRVTEVHHVLSESQERVSHNVMVNTVIEELELPPEEDPPSVGMIGG
jgi:hypothetical protein